MYGNLSEGDIGCLKISLKLLYQIFIFFSINNLSKMLIKWVFCGHVAQILHIHSNIES